MKNCFTFFVLIMCSLGQSRITILAFSPLSANTLLCFDVNQPIEACHGGTESRRTDKNFSSVAKRSSPEISEVLNVYLKRDN